MAADYIKEMRSIQESGPYHLLGWSLGGNVAQEMAVQLQEQGERVVALIIMDAYPVDSKDTLAPGNSTGDLRGVMSGPGDAGELGKSEEAERHVVDEVREYADAFALSDDEAAILARVIKSNIRAHWTHGPREFDGSILVIVAAESHPSGELAAEKWRTYISGEISHSLLPCGHSDMVRTDMLAQVWDAVSMWLGISG